jgi:hypothetical protein
LREALFSTRQPASAPAQSAPSSPQGT